VSGRLLLAALLVLGLAAGCGRGTTRPDLPASASPARGKQLIEYYGCGACHVIGGIATANGHVGPALTNFSADRQIAGTLPNTAANVVRWIRNPQKIAPKTDMPTLGIGRQGAQAIAAYLYGQ
jgi:cytochrome c